MYVISSIIRPHGSYNSRASCLESVSGKKLKSVNIWQSYKQEGGCFMHFARLANTLLKDEESVRDNHILARNFVKYLPLKIHR